jgi:hypothetical protein
LRPGFLTKQLRKPIPGIYSVNSGDPLKEKEALFPFLTDSDGSIEFGDISFSTSGESGKYRILFECAHVELLSQ